MVCSCFFVCSKANRKVSGRCLKGEMESCSNFMLKSNARSEFVLSAERLSVRINRINEALKVRSAKQ